MTRVLRLSWWDRFLWTLRRWGGFPLPQGETVYCYKVRSEVQGLLVDVDWGVMASQRIDGNLGFVPSSGVGQGTPMQRGRVETRSLTYGGGYGKFESNRTRIPLPVLTNYWLSGYPSPTFDKRCIVAGADPREVVEMNHLDPWLPELPAGMPQQALGFGRFYDGELIEGEACTATGLPVHPYCWGPGSSSNSHTQALVVADYVGADGLLTDGPLAGGWFALDPASLSYRRMVAAGGECASRAIALVIYGCRLIDRSGYADAGSREVGTIPHPPKLHTQAGAWVASTNLNKFEVALADLRRVIA
jgi:hypothetical protein